MIFTRTHTNDNVGWFSPELTLTITSGDFLLGIMWLSDLPRWKSPGVSIPGMWVIFAENLKVINADKCSPSLAVVTWTSLFCFDGGQVPQRCLVSKFASSIKCFGLLPQVHAQQGASIFWRNQSSRNFNCIKRNTRFIMSSINYFDLLPQVRTVQALSGSNVFSSDGEAFAYSSACFSMKTTRWAGFACA